MVAVQDAFDKVVDKVTDMLHKDSTPPSVEDVNLDIRSNLALLCKSKKAQFTYAAEIAALAIVYMVGVAREKEKGRKKK